MLLEVLVVMSGDSIAVLVKERAGIHVVCTEVGENFTFGIVDR